MARLDAESIFAGLACGALDADARGTRIVGAVAAVTDLGADTFVDLSVAVVIFAIADLKVGLFGGAGLPGARDAGLKSFTATTCASASQGVFGACDIVDQAITVVICAIALFGGSGGSDGFHGGVKFILVIGLVVLPLS